MKYNPTQKGYDHSLTTLKTATLRKGPVWLFDPKTGDTELCIKTSKGMKHTGYSLSNQPTDWKDIVLKHKLQSMGS